MRKATHYNRILKVLEELKKSHPSYNIGKHISTALDGHDLWGITDSDFFSALKDYQEELSLDVPHKEEDIDKIIKDGLNLSSVLDDDDEYYE